jgi:hypothetical protein
MQMQRVLKRDFSSLTVTLNPSIGAIVFMAM